MRGRERERRSRQRTQSRRTAQWYESFSLRDRGRFRQENGVYDRRVYNQATPFLFTNFPKDWSFKHMWQTFNRLGLGRVLEIDCPKKKDRFGNKFGFVRFLDVMNEGELERRLNNVRIGDHVLQANKPRFSKWDRQVKEDRYNQSMTRRGNHLHTNHRDIRPTYAEMVLEQSGRKGDGSLFRRWEEEPARKVGGNEINKYGHQQRQWKPKQQYHQWSGMEINIDKDEFA
ncbi:hypothetical protein SLA2020_061450 [Shorea laevis]